MELRRVDPHILKKNPGNPRKIQPGELSDAALAASIKAVGILQPPAATEKNGELTIAYQRFCPRSRSACRNRRASPSRPCAPAILAPPLAGSCTSGDRRL